MVIYDEEECLPYEKFQPCLASQQCYDRETSTAACWIFTFAQFFFALILLLYPSIRKMTVRFLSFKSIRNKSVIIQGEGVDIDASLRESSRQFQDSSKGLEKIQAKSEFSHFPITTTCISDTCFDKGFTSDMTPAVRRVKFEKDSNSTYGRIEIIPEEASETFLPQEAIDVASKCDGSNIEGGEMQHDGSMFLNTGIDSMRKSLRRGPLFATHRSEENFLKQNDDESIKYPSEYQPEYVTLHQNNGATALNVCISIFSQQQSKDMIRNSAGFALLAAGMSSFFGIFFSYGHYVKENCPGKGEILARLKDWLIDGAESQAFILDSFKFLPLFLVLAAFAFLVDRWKVFMLTCHLIQGRIQDIGILCGTIPKAPITELHQKHLYTIYRYLNVIHILTLKSFSPSLSDLTKDLSIFTTELNLLTEKEVTLLDNMDMKAREGMIALLTVEIDNLLIGSKSGVLVPKGTVLFTKICDLRSQCSKLHDLFVRDNPNEYTTSIGLFIFLYKVIVACASPLRLHQKSSGILGCFQPGVFGGVFFTFIAISFPTILFTALQNPFSEHGGIKVDNLMASTELTLFQTTRIMWHKCNDVRGESILRSSILRSNSIGRANRCSLKGGYGEL